MGPMTFATCPDCQDKHYCLTPASKEATLAHRLEPFIAQWCLTFPSNSIQAIKLYRAYQAWEAQDGGTPISLKAFGQTIRAMGYNTLKISVIHYQGIHLTPEVHEYASSHLW